jgi:repressor LexA
VAIVKYNETTLATQWLFKQLMVLNPNLSIAQQELYDWVVAYIRDQQHPPSFQQMMIAMKLKSPAPIQSRLAHLRDKGYVQWVDGQARTIQVLKSNRAGGIPVLGAIAAGGLIDPYLDEKERLDVSSFYQGSDHFAVRVTDQSMIDDLISEGDVVIMRPVKDFDDVKDGTVVAARVLGEGMNIKYYQIQIEGSKVILKPNSTQYKLTFNPEQVNLQGAVVGVWRCFDGVR